MAKSLVQTLVTRLKRRVDYNISSDTDLDNLLVDCINDSLKVLYQHLLDNAIFSEITKGVTLSITVSQPYVDLSFTPGASVAALSPVEAGLVTTGLHSYKITFVTADGESEAGAVSNGVTTDTATSGKVALSSIPVSPSSEVTSRKIYRTAADGSTYKLLATISDNTTTTYADNIADASLGADAPSVSTIPAYTEILKVSERTNDKPVVLIPYDEFVSLYPDPTANSNSMPDHAALGPNNRLYLGPTPSASSTAALYFDHMRVPVDVALTGILPYQIKYDPIVLALSRVEFLDFMDSKDRTSIKTAEEQADKFIQKLIVSAAKDIGVSKQTGSRNDVRNWGPRVPTS